MVSQNTRPILLLCTHEGGKGILRMNVGNVTTVPSGGSECHPIINQNEGLVKTSHVSPESEYLIKGDITFTLI